VAGAVDHRLRGRPKAAERSGRERTACRLAIIFGSGGADCIPIGRGRAVGCCKTFFRRQREAGFSPPGLAFDSCQSNFMNGAPYGSIDWKCYLAYGASAQASITVPDPVQSGVNCPAPEAYVGGDNPPVGTDLSAGTGLYPTVGGFDPVGDVLVTNFTVSGAAFACGAGAGSIAISFTVSALPLAADQGGPSAYGDVGSMLVVGSTPFHGVDEVLTVEVYTSASTPQPTPSPSPKPTPSPSPTPFAAVVYFQEDGDLGVNPDGSLSTTSIPGAVAYEPPATGAAAVALLPKVSSSRADTAAASLPSGYLKPPANLPLSAGQYAAINQFFAENGNAPGCVGAFNQQRAVPTLIDSPKNPLYYQVKIFCYRGDVPKNVQTTLAGASYNEQANFVQENIAENVSVGPADASVPGATVYVAGGNGLPELVPLVSGHAELSRPISIFSTTALAQWSIQNMYNWQDLCVRFS
jgi:hypothetical protein